MQTSLVVEEDLAEVAHLCDDYSRKMNMGEIGGGRREEFEDGDGEDDFSFVCGGAESSPIWACDDDFSFPLFDQSLLLPAGSAPSADELPRRPPLKKFFLETDNATPPEPAAGTYCAWKGKAVEVSPEACKKSNSTGFSKIWRFRDLLGRSTSDGKDAFVFLNNAGESPSASSQVHDDARKLDSSAKKAAGETKAKTSVAGGKVRAKKGVSAHEQYLKNRAMREDDRRRSYLPYRPELVGFFTNVNGGLSRNVNPF